MAEQTPVAEPAPATPPAPPTAALPTPPEPKKVEVVYLTLWFDPQGNLQLKGEGMSTYTIIGVLKAALNRFEGVLAAQAPKEPVQVK